MCVWGGGVFNRLHVAFFLEPGLCAGPWIIIFQTFYFLDCLPAPTCSGSGISFRLRAGYVGWFLTLCNFNVAMSRIECSSSVFAVVGSLTAAWEVVKLF